MSPCSKAHYLSKDVSHSKKLSRRMNKTFESKSLFQILAQDIVPLEQVKFTFGIINHYVTLFLSKLLLYKVYIKLEFLFKVPKVHSLRVSFKHFQPLF